MTWTQLHDACKHLDIENIQYRCKYQPNEIKDVDDHGWNPLHLLFLSWTDDNDNKSNENNEEQKITLVEVVESFLHQIGNISTASSFLIAQDIYGNTPLHILCMNQHIMMNSTEVVHNVIGICPSLPSIPNKEGLMPLHTACRYASHNNENIIRYLINVYPQALRSRIKMGDPAPRRRKKNSFAITTKKARADQVAKENNNHFFVHASTAGGMLCFENQENNIKFSMNEQIRDGSYPLHMIINAAFSASSRHHQAVAVANDAVSISTINMLIKQESSILLRTNKFGETPLHIALSKYNHHKHNNDSDSVDNATTDKYYYYYDTLIQMLIDRCGIDVLQLKDKRNGNLPIHILSTKVIINHHHHDENEYRITTTNDHHSNNDNVITTCSCIQHIESMLNHYPDSIDVENNQGKTPLDLAKETLITKKSKHNVIIKGENDGDMKHNNPVPLFVDDTTMNSIEKTIFELLGSN